MNRRHFLMAAASGAAGLLSAGRAEGRWFRRSACQPPPRPCPRLKPAQRFDPATATELIGTFRLHYTGGDPAGGVGSEWEYRYTGPSGSPPYRVALYDWRYDDYPPVFWNLYGILDAGTFEGTIRNYWNNEYLQGVGTEVWTTPTFQLGCQWLIAGLPWRYASIIHLPASGERLHMAPLAVPRTTQLWLITDEDQIARTGRHWYLDPVT